MAGKARRLAYLPESYRRKGVGLAESPTPRRVERGGARRRGGAPACGG